MAVYIKGDSKVFSNSRATRGDSHGHFVVIAPLSHQVQFDILQVLALTQVIVVRHRQQARAVPPNYALHEAILDVRVEHLEAPHGGKTVMRYSVCRAAPKRIEIGSK